GRLDDDVRAELRPVDRGRVALGQDHDRGIADDDRVRRVLYRAAQAAVGGVVDRYHLQVAALQRETRERAPDAAEAVDAHPGSHVASSSLMLSFRSLRALRP